MKVANTSADLIMERVHINRESRYHRGIRCWRFYQTATAGIHCARAMYFGRSQEGWWGRSVLKTEAVSNPDPGISTVLGKLPGALPGT